MTSERRERRTSETGLSLLEVLIGVIIISLAAVMLVVNSRSAVKGQLRSKVYGDAATATREVMEQIQLLPLDSVSRLKGGRMAHSQGPAIDVFATARPLQASDVEDISALDTSTLRHVTLRTVFESVNGGRATKTFTSVVYRP